MSIDLPNLSGAILVVDDEPSLARAIARTLVRAGLRAVEATSVAEALAIIERGGIEAVLSDIAMPGQDGLALLREVRRRDLDLPVLLMTGAPELETAITAVELGALKYLTKPFETPTLIESVRQAQYLYRLAKAKRQVMSLVGSSTGEGSDRAGLETTFERAIAGLWMAYQPIVAADGTLYGYEALLRCGDPALHPGLILDAANRLERLPELSGAIRRRIVEDLRDADPSWTVFVNLHPLDLLDPAFVDAALAPFAGVPQRVVLEVTERATLDAIPDLGDRVQVLRHHGHGIAIDDLGAGYSGLSSFLHLRPEVVKLDMHLTRGIDGDRMRRQLVGSMTAMCHELGATVVAEGVETAAERDTLLSLGCDFLQGYFLGRPARPFATV